MILKDVSLAAIVRDEKMNPAGGIQRFVESTVPYVEEAVIVDTGSKDGTRGILEELEAQYDNLRVLDHEFNGYGPSRNISLQAVKTKMALILDADELILPEDYEVIQEELLRDNRQTDWYFAFKHIDGQHIIEVPTHSTRIVGVKSTSFIYPVWEETTTTFDNARYIDVNIFHFVPPQRGRRLKHSQWYKQDFEAPTIPAPSTMNSFHEWKAFNPVRDDLDYLRSLTSREHY